MPHGGTSVARCEFPRRLQIIDDDIYSSQGFRRGAAQELKETGSPRDVVAASGVWNSPAFRIYVDLSDGAGDGVRNFPPVVTDSDSESSDGDR